MKRKKKGKNICPKGRMEDHVSSGEGRRTEEEVRRKQKNCGYQKGKGKNTDLRERTEGPLLCGEGGKQEGELM